MYIVNLIVCLHKGDVFYMLDMNNFIPISKKAADNIRDMIFIEKRFTPGSKLPNENELMKELRISRTSLREAIKILIANKILYIKRGSGTFVCDFDNESDIALNTLYPVKNIKLVKNAFELRLILEPEMAFNAVKYVTKSDVNEIERLERECRNKILSGEAYSDEDKKFHAAIARLSNNRLFEELMGYLYASIANTEEARNLSKKEIDTAINKLNENAIVYHKLILESIIKKDAYGVKISMETHINNSQNIFSSIIPKNVKSYF